jgi:2-amino-4-hydroxy-6-hydroxymethyldihydropteridine diphosphokinase
MSRAVLSIGSNVGLRLAMLQIAVDAFRPWLQTASPVYETPPWGPVPQDDYLNAVLIVADADAKPQDWLDRAHAAERAAGRTRDVHWGPRTLDVDVVAVDDVESADPDLTLPHPRAGERAFVLVPWQAVDPAASLSGRPVTAWLAALPAGEVAAVRRVEGAALA